MTPEQARKILKVVPQGSPYHDMAIKALKENLGKISVTPIAGGPVEKTPHNPPSV
jgi:hypothetical protein